MTNQQKASTSGLLPRVDLTDPYERLRLVCYLRSMRGITTRDRRLSERRAVKRNNQDRRRS